MKKNLILIIFCFIFVFSGCSKADNNVNVNAPDKISTVDEAKIKQNFSAAEKSNNVNGMRYNINLEQFSQKYNEMLKEMGNIDMINGRGWKKKGGIKTDSNGVKIQYYYYDDDKINFTATVETETDKIMNIGLGTTMSNFVSIKDDRNYSDIVLMKSGVMAASACGYAIDQVNILQDIFYRTTFENTSEIWYEGNVFCLSTSEDKGNSERSTMLFRVFPISDELKEKWKIIEYENYIASLPADNVINK